MDELNIIANFNVNEQNYVAILEKNDDTKVDEIYLYGYILISDDEIKLREIESEIEYKIALSRMQELFYNT